MNETNQIHEPSNFADLHDRLMDSALAETIGGETPPDLSAQICSRSNSRSSASTASSGSSMRKIGLSALAVAATISIVGATVFLFADGNWRSAGQVSSVSDRSRGLVRELPQMSTSSQIKAEYKPRLASRARSKEAAEPDVDLFHSRLAEIDGLAGRATADGEAQTESGKIKSPSWFGLSQTRPMGAVDVPGIQIGDGQLNDVELRRKYFPKSGSTRGSELTDPPPAPGTTFGFRGTPDEVAGEPALVADATTSSMLLDLQPGPSGDRYDRIHENPFIKASGGDAVSTFSIDVDTASYANVRQFLMDMRQLPPPDAVRLEELVNYFHYDYAGPTGDDKTPFAAHVEVAGCPWAAEHRLVRIGIKGREIAREKRPPSNLVFLVDVSGSMDEPNKLPLVVDGLRELARELGENDRVAIVVYASSEGLALESTRGDKQADILAALNRLQAGGSTAGGAGIQLAYQIAEDHFILGGTNRVVLCTDGDFNVGVTSTGDLERLVAQKAKDTKVFLSVLGFGRGNLNDAMMQTIADRGNGNHHYIDNLREARKVLVEEMAGTLITIAKDVKIQVEFNPAQVAGYRLLGYENRMLRTEDFNDDTKDAGEIGAGHTVTALYEVIPAGKSLDVPATDPLKYQPQTQPVLKSSADDRDDSGSELLTLKMRYKEPTGDKSRKLEWPISDAGKAFGDATDDFRFAAAVAGFGLLLRDSQFKGDASYETVAEIAAGSLGSDPHGYRSELVELVRRARELQSGR